MSKILKVIETALAPKPVASYSVAVQADNTLYISGAIGTDKNTSKIVAGGIAPETHQVFKNLKEILHAGGSSFNKVAHVRVYLTNIQNAAEVDKIYREYVEPPFPARVMLEVSKLPLGAQIEVEAIALITDKSRI